RGLTWRVVHLAHLVHVDERVEPGQVHPGERPPDREPLSLEPGRRRGYRQHGALGHRGCVWLRNARQHQDVRNGDGGHVFSSAWAVVSPNTSFAATTVVDSSTFPAEGPDARVFAHGQVPAEGPLARCKA